VEIEMLPLSFKEFVDHLKDRSELQKKYVSYLTGSAFPYALELRHDPMLVRDYLQGIFNTVLLKDVVARLRVADVMMLESLIRFLFDNIGSVVSTKKISDTMTSSGRRISTHTVESYIQGLRDSFIIYQARRYDIRGRQYLKSLEKYYAVDMGLRTFTLGKRGGDVGHVLENVVYLELLRRGYNVFVGKIDDNEVDFVAMDGKGIRYFQVAASVREATTLERELKPLRKINDAYPKMLLTLDDDPEGDIDGIRIVNALEFLLDE
jgi:predicted AAA+ superfamily ATPase